MAILEPLPMFARDLLRTSRRHLADLGAPVIEGIRTAKGREREARSSSGAEGADLQALLRHLDRAMLEAHLAIERAAARIAQTDRVAASQAGRIDTSDLEGRFLALAAAEDVLVRRARGHVAGRATLDEPETLEVALRYLCDAFAELRHDVARLGARPRSLVALLSSRVAIVRSRTDWRPSSDGRRGR